MAEKVIITQSNYIPWKGYFDAIASCDCFVIYDDMQYTKRDWRNRNIIKTSSGLQWLTIPVQVKGKFLQKINETIIDDKDWRFKHWDILKSGYKKSACYHEVKDWVESLYSHCTFERLTDINEYFIKAILNYLGITVVIKRSEEFTLAAGKTERLVNICRELGAKEYFTGPAAAAYMDESKFGEHHIKINYIDYSGYKPYPQAGAAFDDKVSVLDLVFNAGSESPLYLKNIK